MVLIKLQEKVGDSAMVREQLIMLVDHFERWGKGSEY